MDEETAMLAREEQQRAQVLKGRMTQGEAALVLGRSLREVKRLTARYRAAGPAGLVHGNRGRTPWQAVAPDVTARVVALARGRYAGLNQQHLTEKLGADE